MIFNRQQYCLQMQHINGIASVCTAFECRVQQPRHRHLLAWVTVHIKLSERSKHCQQTLQLQPGGSTFTMVTRGSSGSTMPSVRVLADLHREDKCHMLGCTRARLSHRAQH